MSSVDNLTNTELLEELSRASQELVNQINNCDGRFSKASWQNLRRLWEEISNRFNIH